MRALSSLLRCVPRALVAAWALALAGSPCAQQPPTEPPVAHDSQWCDVLVVDAETGAPLPGIEVGWNDDRLLQWPLPAIGGPLHVPGDGRFVPFQRHATSDAAGRLRVHYGNHALVHVSTGSFRGSLFVGGRGDGRPQPDELQRLVLEPFVPWPVRVVDGADRPLARTAVVLSLAEAPASGNAVLASSAMGGDGTGELAIPKALFASKEAAPRVRLVASIAGREGEPLLVSANELHKPLVLRAPPVGSVHVTVSVAGAPCTEGAFVDVLATQERGQQQLATLPLGPDGTVVIDGLPPATELLVRARLDNVQIERVVDGPAAAGDRTSVGIELAVAPYSLTGRLLGPDGAPVPKGNVQATAMAGGAAWNASLAVGDDGRFRWRLCEAELAPTTIDALSFTRQQRFGASWTFTRQQLATTAGGDELGDVPLRAPPLLLRARVVVDGQPVVPPTAFVVESLQPPIEGQAAAVWAQARGHQYEPRWGGFLLWGAMPGRRHRVRFSDPGFVAADPVEFEAGADDVEIVLERAETLTAEALLPDGLDADDVRFELVPERGGAERAAPGAASAWLAECQAKGEAAAARWASLPRGRYTLHVGPSAWRTPALVVRDVEVPAPDGGDPRLVELDLRARVRLLDVRVTRPQGRDAPAETAAVFVDPDPAQTEWNGVAVQHGIARVPVPLRPVDLLVAAPDLQPVRLRDVRGNVQAELRAWPMLRVDLEDCGELPAGFEVMVRVDTGAGAALPDGTARIGDAHVSRYRLLQPMPIVPDAVGAGFTVAAATVERPLIVWLRAPWGVRPLVQLTPAKAPAGSGRVRVRLDAAELQAAIAAMRAAESGRGR